MGNFNLVSTNKDVYKLSQNSNLNGEIAFAAVEGNNHVIIELDAKGKVKRSTQVSGRGTILIYLNF